MPKPSFVSRRSGTYVRFFVPTDLQARVGSQYLVRPLYAANGDEARLVAARIGFGLSRAFQALRSGLAVNLDAVVLQARVGAYHELGFPPSTESTAALQRAAATSPLAELGSSRRRVASMQAMGDRGVIDAVNQHCGVNGGADKVPAMPRAPAVPRLAKAIADHVGDLERARLNSKTILESRHTLRLFAGIVGEDIALADVAAAHIRAFFDGVRWWPSNASTREPYRGKPVVEVIKLAQANDEPAPAAYTIAKHRQRLSVFFRSLVDAGVLARSPLAGVRVVATPNVEDKGEPFTDAQLQAIFDPVEFPKWARKYPHRWFGPILGLYSGARVNEIAQLRVSDIESIDGIPGFHVRRSASDQSVKNKASRRFVPLAQAVIDAGFLTYVEEARRAGHVQLFPNLPNSTGLGYGRQLSRQFSAYIKQRGITAKGQGFHGFRHTFASNLDKAGASGSAIGALTGHGTGQAVLEKFYIDRRTLPDRLATLEKFAPRVGIPAYQAGKFVSDLPQSAR